MRRTLFILAFFGLFHELAFAQCTYTPYPKTFAGSVPAGNNLVNNGNFEDGVFGTWFNDPNEDAAVEASAKRSGSYGLRAYAGAFKFKTVQSIPTLESNKTYNLTFWMKSYSGAPTILFRFWYLDENSAWQNAGGSYSPTTSWQQYTIPITTSSACWSNNEIRIEIARYQYTGVYIDDIEIIATGNEFSPVNYSTPPVQNTVFFEDFDNAESGTILNPQKWLVVKKQWSSGHAGPNRGVVPENLELTGNSILFKGHGDNYTGSVQGFGGTKRVGSCIATKDYYASGRYEVRAKIAPVGVCTAFWTYHYIEDEYDASSPGTELKNTEIDWEFPGDNLGAGSLQHARCNTWGGKCNGWTGEYSGRGDLFSAPTVSSVNDIMNAWHVYRIDWHTGGGGETPRIEWYIDDVLVDYYDHSTLGSDDDNVGFRATRFWLGVWYSSWSGLPDHDEVTCEVDWVKITPFNEANDVFENETVPSDGFSGTCAYPLYPVTAPTADFTVNNSSSCTGQSVTYTNASSGSISSYNWNFGTNATPATATGVGPHSVSYSSTGNKNISLSLTGPGGSDSETKTSFVSIASPSITGPIAGNSVVACNATGENYAVTNNTGSSYTWSVPSGATIVSGQGSNAIVVDFGTTTGSISVSQLNSAGCTSALETKAVTGCVSSNVKEKGVPQVSFYPNPFVNEGVLETDGESYQIQLFDISGSLLFSGTTKDKTQLGTSLPSGVYFLRVYNDSNTETIRITKY